MLFKLSNTVDRLYINSKDTLNLKLKGEENIHILLRAPNDEDRSKDYKGFDAFLDITGDFKPSKKSLPVFYALIDGKRPPEGKKVNSAEDMIYRVGPSYSLEHYPNPFITVVDNVHTKLSSTSRKIIDILRWMHSLEGPPSPIRCGGLVSLSCSNNGISWYSIPGRNSIRSVTRMTSGFELHKVDGAKVLDYIEANSLEPLGHELLREAKELQFSSPRSAVLIAVSALEVSIKSVIIEKAPEAKWLVDNLQSPPVEKILIDYFPTLFKDETKFYWPTKDDRIFNIILDAIKIRNELAHKGGQPPHDKKVAEIIGTVQKLLWVCDYYSGHKWAEAYIQSSST